MDTEKSSILGVWATLGGRGTLQKGGGLRPPPCWKVSRPPGVAQTPKIDDFRSVKKSYTKKPGVNNFARQTIGSDVYALVYLKTAGRIDLPVVQANIFTPGFLLHDFLTDRRSSILGVWAAPGGRGPP